jgi:DNA uptake protein ComE-like DNA-binding protein
MYTEKGIGNMPSKLEQQDHGHPGQKEPRSHGETHHENRIVDLNYVSEEELANLPMVGKQRAQDLIRHRPFRSWEEVEKVPGISKGMVDDLKSGGAQLGGE